MPAKYAASSVSRVASSTADMRSSSPESVFRELWPMMVATRSRTRWRNGESAGSFAYGPRSLPRVGCDIAK